MSNEERCDLRTYRHPLFVELDRYRTALEEMRDKIAEASAECGRRDGVLYMLLWDAIDIATTTLSLCDPTEE